RGPVLAGPGLAGVQAAPAARPVAPAGAVPAGLVRHLGVRGGPGGGRRLDDADAGLLVGVLLPRGAARRPGDRGPGLLLVRGPAAGPRHSRVRAAGAAPVGPAAGDRD